MNREKSLVKNLGVLSIGTFVRKLLSFVTLPILTAYLTKEEQKNKTITVNFKNYYDKYEVESFNSASKEIKLHKYDFYLKENEKADVATLLNGISYNSANISKTENLDKGDGYVIGKKKGSAYVTLNYKTKDAEGNEISKSVTRYIYVYKPLEFELSGYYQ